MNIVRCDVGHFYDSDRFGTCPHCTTRRYEPPRERLSSFRGFPDRGFDEFRMVEEIGSGSSGSVYHVQKVTDYAVRIVSWNDRNEHLEAIREYEIAKRLQQWNCFLRYESYAEKGIQVFLLQELATSWPEYVEEEDVSVGKVLSVIQNLCDALSYMRSVGLLHINVSPTGIFMKDGKVKLGGFAHVIPLKPGEEYEGGSGTFPYMAPEICINGCCNGTEDIYSLGITMYYMLTGGKLPFCKGVPEEPVRRESDTINTMFMNSELLQIIRKATAYRPSDRYSMPEELKEAVARFMQDHMMEMSEVIPQEDTDNSGNPGDFFKYEGMDLPTFENDDVSADDMIIDPPDSFPVPEDDMVFDRPTAPEEHSTLFFEPTSFEPPNAPQVPELMPKQDEYVRRKMEEYYQSQMSMVETCPGPEWKKWGDGKEVSFERESDQHSEEEKSLIDEVQFTAVLEKKVQRNDVGIIDIAMFKEEYKDAILDQIREEFTGEMKKVFSNPLDVKRDTMVKVRLSGSGVEIPRDVEEYRWNGKYLKFAFDYAVPADYPSRRILFRADVYFDEIISTTLRFTVDVEEGTVSAVERETVKTAFLSYAREDLVTATYILQAIRKARPDMDVFFDVEKLRSGDNWEERLYEELMRRDRLFLCWSHHAAASKWVEREWRYMYEHKGLESIEPFPIENHRICPAPPELHGLHFDDIETVIRTVYSDE